MTLADILQAATAKMSQADAERHFEEVAKAAPPELLGQGVAEALRSDQTPPIEQMVSQLFGRSNPTQQAGLLNGLIRSLGPVVLAGVAGKVLAGLSNNGSAPVSPEHAGKISPQQIQEITRDATTAQPGVADQLGKFYAEHPMLVKGLGGVALLIALSKMRDSLGR